MGEEYTSEARSLLLFIARQTLTAMASGQPRPAVPLDALPASLKEKRACFVTLTHHGDLRGCTGTLFARRPLAEEVAFITGQTAFEDPRFPPVTAEEAAECHIEISVLTPPQPLPYHTPDELLSRLRPFVDGVVIYRGFHRATLLPDVWERYSDPADFLSALCRKAGMAAEAWRVEPLTVEVYQTVIFQEPH